MRRISVANVESVQATSEKQSIFCESVVEVVVYKLSELGINR
jgi:hypothetical protein